MYIVVKMIIFYMVFELTLSLIMEFFSGLKLLQHHFIITNCVLLITIY